MKISQRDKIHVKTILRYINGIHEYLENKNLDELYYNSMLFDAVLMNLFQIGEVSTRLSISFRNKVSKIKWAEIRAFRNLVAHDYLSMKTQIVIDIIDRDLIDLEKELIKFDLT